MCNLKYSLACVMYSQMLVRLHGFYDPAIYETAPRMHITLSILQQVSITMIATGFGSGIVEAALRPAAQRQPQQKQQQQQAPARQIPIDRYILPCSAMHKHKHAWQLDRVARHLEEKVPRAKNVEIRVFPMHSRVYQPAPTYACI